MTRNELKDWLTTELDRKIAEMQKTGWNSITIAKADNVDVSLDYYLAEWWDLEIIIKEYSKNRNYLCKSYLDNTMTPPHMKIYFNRKRKKADDRRMHKMKRNQRFNEWRSRRFERRKILKENIWKLLITISGNSLLLYEILKLIINAFSK